MLGERWVSDYKAFYHVSQWYLIPPPPPWLVLFFLITYFNWKLITLQYCGGFLPYIDMNWPWMYMYNPILNPSPTSLPTLALWVVPEHQIWVPCFTHGTCAGHLFYIWDVHNAVLSNHPTLAFSHQVRKSLLYICVSFAALYVGSMVPSF